mgnify:CR=1 FL=1
MWAGSHHWTGRMVSGCSGVHVQGLTLGPRLHVIVMAHREPVHPLLPSVLQILGDVNRVVPGASGKQWA